MISFRQFSLQGQTVYFRNCKVIRHQGRAIFFLLFCSLDNFRQFFRQNLNLLKYLSLDLRDLHTTNYAPIQCTVWSHNILSVLLVSEQPLFHSDSVEYLHDQFRRICLSGSRPSTAVVIRVEGDLGLKL